MKIETVFILKMSVKKSCPPKGDVAGQCVLCKELLQNLVSPFVWKILLQCNLFFPFPKYFCIDSICGCFPFAWPVSCCCCFPLPNTSKTAVVSLLRAKYFCQVSCFPLPNIFAKRVTVLVSPFARQILLPCRLLVLFPFPKYFLRVSCYCRCSSFVCQLYLSRFLPLPLRRPLPRPVLSWRQPDVHEPPTCPIFALTKSRT